MLLNYLKLALRLLVRNPFFTFINVLGLAVGYASFFILWQHASTELKTDQHHKDFERIARIGFTIDFTDDGIKRGHIASGGIVANQIPMIANDFRQVVNYTRLLQQPMFSDGPKNFVGHSKNVIISVSLQGGRKEIFKETRMAYADPNLFEFFNIPLISGSKKSVLKDAHSVVLSQSTANKYFGSTDPIGKLMLVNDSVLLNVTGVFQNIPHNSHLAFDLVASNVGLETIWREQRYLMTSGYIKLDSTIRFADFAIDVNKYKTKYWAPHLRDFPNWQFEMSVQPLQEIAFGPPVEYAPSEQKNKSILVLLQFVSVLVLVMAWINYCNLSITRMIKRMKEVATRKMSGALSSDFLKQFLIESTLINLLAVGLAFTLMQLVRTPLMLFFDIHITEFSSITPNLLWIFFLATITGVVISGLYPAIMSASYNPRSLFALSRKGPQKRWLQSILTTGQYASALILILWAFIISLQLNYILHKDIGILREQIVVIDAPVLKTSTYLSDFNYFLNEVRSVPGVEGATHSVHVIGDDINFVFLRGKDQPASTNIAMDSNGGVDESFLPFYGIRLIAGRNFVPNDRSDVILLSRRGTERLGYQNPADAVGDKVNNGAGEIIGVIEDYRFKPLVNISATSTYAETGRGICLVYGNKNVMAPSVPERLSIKVGMNEVDKTIASIQEKYAAVFPGNLFNWYFLDDHINKAYDTDKISRNQIALFTILAIGISCLGLLGMMTALAEDKTKEIGIRKVMGASMRQIGTGLLKNIIIQIAVAIVIALPVAYYLADQYLQRFLEKIALQWWHFVLPVGILITIMLVTISSILYRAARTNPVESLRYE